MENRKLLQTKPWVNVGTIGHIDHGHTTVAAAIGRENIHIGRSHQIDSLTPNGGFIVDDAQLNHDIKAMLT